MWWESKIENAGDVFKTQLMHQPKAKWNQNSMKFKTQK